MASRLTAKQELFVAEYLVDLNATQAAIRAGYAPKDADVQGPRLLGNVGIATAIARAQAERSGRVGITAERVLEEYARIAFADMGSFAEWDADGVTFRPSSDIDTRCIAEVKETPRALGRKALSIKLHDKVAALNALAKHLGLTPDRHEVTGPGGAPITIREVIVNLPSEDANVS